MANHDPLITYVDSSVFDNFSHPRELIIDEEREIAYALSSFLEGSRLFKIDAKNDQYTLVNHINFTNYVVFDWDKTDNKIYVVLSDMNELFIIDAESFKVTDRIDLGLDGKHYHVQDMAVNGLTDKIYITFDSLPTESDDNMSGMLLIVDAKSKNIINKIASDLIRNLQIDESRNLLYFIEFRPNQLIVIDDNENVRIVDIPTEHPYVMRFIIDSTLNHAYIYAAANDSQVKEILVVDLSTDPLKVIQRVTDQTLFYSEYPMIMESEGKRLSVEHTKYDVYLVVSDINDDGKPIKKINMNDPKYSEILAIDKTNNRLYVGAQGGIAVYNIDTLLSNGILDFVDPEKDPKYYIERYLNEDQYRDWFDRNYPDHTIYEAVGTTESEYFENNPDSPCEKGHFLKNNICIPQQKLRASITDVIQIDRNTKIIESEDNVYYMTFRSDSIQLFDMNSNLIFEGKGSSISSVWSMIIDEYNDLVFVSSGDIYVFDKNSGELLQKITSTALKFVQTSPDKLYVIAEGNIDIYSIKDKRLELEDTIKVSHFRLRDILIEGNTAYVLSEYQHYLGVVNLETKEVKTHLLKAVNNQSRFTAMAKNSHYMYILDTVKDYLMKFDIAQQKPVKQIPINTQYASDLLLSENNRLYVPAKTQLFIFDLDLNEIIELRFPSEMWFEMAINKNENVAYLKSTDVILVMDLDCSCPAMYPEDAKEMIYSAILKNSPSRNEDEAKRIVADFGSDSLSIVEFSNEDWKPILDYQQDFIEKNKERFDPELIRTTLLMEYDSSYDAIDIIMDDAGLTSQFYTGYSDRLKEIFKTKLQQIDDLYDQDVNKINDLDMETPKKEYYIRELDKGKEQIKALHLAVATKLLQPMEEKIKVSKDNQRIRSEIENYSDKPGGGCLIATAAYGTELSPQVQLLRELRDNKLLNTESGTSFMKSFNDFYYSFSPYIADYERENPVFKKIMKISLTPLLTSLSLLNYVEMDTEESVLGYGISMILLNASMYFISPVLAVLTIRNYLKSKN